MTRIDELSEAKTKQKNELYFKIKAGGLTYSIFDKAEAFNQLKNKEIQVGDEVDIDFSSNKVGEVTYKNVNKFTKLNESVVSKPLTDKQKYPTGPHPKFDAQDIMIRQSATKNCAELAKTGMFDGFGGFLKHCAIVEKAIKTGKWEE